MGRLLREQNLAPDFILSSSAKRAHKTAEAVADQCGSQPEIKRCRELYTIDADAYLDLLHDLPDTYQRVMIVGHNPVCEEFLHLLTGEEVSLPTAAVACVQLPIQSWEEINSETNGQGLQVWCPRELP